ncbi:MAG: response regulator [Pirellulaceae bacterium]
MIKKALIVEDDPHVLGYIEDTLCSLNHEHVWVTNQHDARQRFQEEQFDYVLLDLQIPAKPNRGGANVTYGVNLLREIMGKPPRRDLPVIIMTAYTAEGLNLSNTLRSDGAADFIAKPFETSSRPLDKVIGEVLGRFVAAPEVRPPEPPSCPQPFTGGELVFGGDRVTLCDVTVLVNSRSRQMQRILNELCQRNSSGSYIPLSGPELVSRLGLAGGQNSVAGAVRDFRRNVTEVLLAERGLTCGPQDVIRSGGPGYRLNEWIIACNPGGQPASAPSDTFTDDVTTDRCERILAELQKGERLRSPAIAARLGCTARTIKRDLDVLRAEGTIEFVGPSKSGYYRITTKASRTH